MVFGAGIPLGFEDPKPYVIQNLGRMVYSVVPAVILLGGFIPLGEWLAAGAAASATRAWWPAPPWPSCTACSWASWRCCRCWPPAAGCWAAPSRRPILLADLNAVVLGLQLLLWAAALGLLLRSNRGLAVLLAYGLTEVGRVMAWGGEFLGDLDVPKGLVKAMASLGNVPAHRPAAFGPRGLERPAPQPGGAAGAGRPAPAPAPGQAAKRSRA